MVPLLKKRALPDPPHLYFSDVLLLEAAIGDYYGNNQNHSSELTNIHRICPHARIFTSLMIIKMLHAQV